MQRSTWSLIFVVISLILASPRPAAAQDGVRYGFAGGLNLTSAPGVDGQHIFGSVYFPETPILGLGTRIDAALLNGTSDGTGTLNLLGNLRLPFLEAGTVNGYAIAGAGVAAGSWGGAVLNAGVGAEKLADGRPIFLEFGTRFWGGSGPSSGVMMLSFGTLF